MKGWLTGAKEILEKVQDPSVADTVNPSTYKYRVSIELETGDERFAFVNNLMWVGTGCRRANEGEFTFTPFSLYLPEFDVNSTRLQSYSMHSASLERRELFFF